MRKKFKPFPSHVILLFRLFEVTETVTGIYLMMEYAHGGELFVRLTEQGSYTESEAKPIFAQIASAIEYMVYLQSHQNMYMADTIFEYLTYLLE
jgi:serine/threonine protein kinase